MFIFRRIQLLGVQYFGMYWFVELQEKRRTTILLRDLTSALKCLSFALNSLDAKARPSSTGRFSVGEVQLELAIFIETRDQRQPSGWGCGKVSSKLLVCWSVLPSASLYSFCRCSYT